MSDHLLIIGDREALAWILITQRMAFPGYRRREVSVLAPGDGLFLYTTRGCFRNPTRDRGRVIGFARAKDAPVELAAPVEVSGRSFELGCHIELLRLAPRNEGIDFVPLVPELSSFPNKHGWATRLRRPLVPLNPEDSDLLARRLARVARRGAAAADTYLQVIPERAVIS